MAVTPYNLKNGAYVSVNANGSYGSNLNKTTNKATAIQKYNKGTKVGQLTGGVQSPSIGGKKYEMVEVLLTSPVKPNFLTTHYRLWFQSASLDVITEKAPTPKLPDKVVKRAEKKVVTKKTTSPKTTKPEVATGQTYQDYYDEVPEKQTDYVKIGIGVLLLGLAVAIGRSAYKKYKKSKQ